MPLLPLRNGFLFLTPLLLSNISTAGAQTFKDFLIMNVCTTSSGAVDAQKVPGRDICTSQRNVNGGEGPPYHLRDFPNTTGTNCKAKISGREVTNTIVLYSGNIRTLGYVDVGFDPNEDPNCVLSSSDPRFRDRARAATEDRASVRWIESNQSGIGFLMASGDGTDLSYWTTPLCNTFPNDSRKFYRGWPLSSIAMPQMQTFEWTFQDTYLTTAAAAPPLDSFGNCPASYRSAFMVWTRDSFTYKSGINATSLVSYHYTSRSGAANPGDSKALERAYFTDEWGFSRYELWHREDYYGTDTTSRQRTKDEAFALFNTGRCGTPYDTPRNPTPDMTTGTVITSGKYAEKIINGTSGVGEYWYVVNCRDYTRFIQDSTRFLPSLFDIDLQYQAFWK
jgi:hypothetical protein